MGRERHHNLARGRPVHDGETFGRDRSRLNRHVIGVENQPTLVSNYRGRVIIAVSGNRKEWRP